MAAVAPPTITITEGENLSISGKNISTKTAHFKFGTSVSTSDTVLEVITPDSKEITTGDQINMGDGNSYVIETIKSTPVKYASGVPILNQKTNVVFPTQEAKQYTPEKIATFLIFKK